MRSFKTLAIVINRKNFGEADRILTVFSKDKGKIKIIAKGVRRIKSRRSAQVELLNLSALSITDHRLPVLTEAENIKHFPALKENLKKSGIAFYLCELVDGLTAERQQHPEVYELLEETLGRLEQEENYKKLVSEFEQNLLSVLGFWPREQLMLEDKGNYIEDLMEKQIKSKRILRSIWKKI
jgi:DNA repair protein RecO (recombination protein O)